MTASVLLIQESRSLAETEGATGDGDRGTKGGRRPERGEHLRQSLREVGERADPGNTRDGRARTVLSKLVTLIYLLSTATPENKVSNRTTSKDKIRISSP